MSSKLIVDTIEDSTGTYSLALGSGNSTFPGGIHIGGTGSANLLDDYEEGTSTVTLRGGSSEPGTLASVTLYYVKIGEMVHFQFGFENWNTTGYSGDLYFDGLPFANTSSSRAVVAVSFYSMATWTDTPMGIIDAGSSSLQPRDIRTNATWAAVAHAAGTGRYAWATGTYRN